MREIETDDLSVSELLIALKDELFSGGLTDAAEYLLDEAIARATLDSLSVPSDTHETLTVPDGGQLEYTKEMYHTWFLKSISTPHAKDYVVQSLDYDGHLLYSAMTCTCKAYRYGKGKDCKHIDLVRQGDGHYDGMLNATKVTIHALAPK